jgi:pimeloyl-ACP methyl ester carboxylesterase
MYPAKAPGIAVRFLSVRDGVRLRVLEAGPPAGRPVVLLHGWGASVYSWRAAIPALAAAGHRVIAADLPGHGLSDKPMDPGVYTRPAMIETAAALLDALDVHDATVAGVSMGGAIAAGLAIGGHRRVGRVALINPAGFGPVRFVGTAQLLTPMALRDYATYLVARPLVSGFLHLAYADRSRVTERDVDEYWATSNRPGFAAALVACLHGFSWDPYAPSELGGIACAVLLVIGTRDHLISGSESRAAAIPRLRVVHVDGGHAVNEERPDEVNAALAAFAGE